MTAEARKGWDRGVYAPIVAVLCAVTTLSACSSSRVLTLGTRKPKIVSGPTLLEDLIPKDLQTGITHDVSNATLTADMKEAVLLSNKKVFIAERTSLDVRFGPPVQIVVAGNDATSPAISADGRILWFARPATITPTGAVYDDVWMSTRANRTDAWSEPVHCAELSTPDHDLPRPSGRHGLVLPMSVGQWADRWSFEIIFASREDTDGGFTPPLRAPELPHPPEGSATDPFLSDDGRLLLYSDEFEGKGDIMLATHSAWHDPFENPEPIDGVNTPDWKEGDPWLSPDGKTLYFTSNRAMNPDPGVVADDGGVVTNRNAHLDRIYRVEFDVPWTP